MVHIIDSDCPDCGQPTYTNEWWQCPDCGNELCYHCMENHVCVKCAACGHEVNKTEGKLLEEYGEWVCNDDCHIEFLTEIIEERDNSKLARLCKKAAATGNIEDLRAYLEERRKAV